MQLVNIFKSAAFGYGTEKRILLLHGPVGSSKSTIARLLKKGLEVYSNQKEGALYTFGWRVDQNTTGHEGVQWCPMHEEPLHLIPLESAGRGLRRDQPAASPPRTIASSPPGDLCPVCRKIYQDLMTELRRRLGARHRATCVVQRLILSEKDRVGIGTFQPKDEKNQDSTELTGDINYRKIAEYGSDSDPRAFNFDGEFNIANRGIIEFIEILKLDVAFLYDLLGASQEHKIKPKKFAADRHRRGHHRPHQRARVPASSRTTSSWRRFRDRTVKIDIPYITRLAGGGQDLRARTSTRGRSRASTSPRTRSRWRRCGRSSRAWRSRRRPRPHAPPEAEALRRQDAARLHRGQHQGAAQGGARARAWTGISPRYIQDKISNALVSDDTATAASTRSWC